MLTKFIKTEVEYIRNFSKSFENDYVIRFTDDNIPDMYAYNCTILKSNNSSDELKRIIINEIELAQKNNSDFLKIESDFIIQNEIINELPISPEVAIDDFMYIKPDKYNEINGNTDCYVSKAVTSDILGDGMKVDILANEGNMGSEFAKRRIKRKAEIYKDSDKNLNLYVCYHNGNPIGNCELFIDNDIAKIEDFDILEKYQRKGFGSSVLKHLLKHCLDSNINFAYLITDSNDTAKEMYEKCGLKKIGNKTELFFKFK